MQKAHALTVGEKKKRLSKCRELLKRFRSNSLKQIIFSDEKLFTTEPVFNLKMIELLLQTPLVSRKKVELLEEAVNLKH